jgi:LPXTG-site transpeptidase (sortase) family protein
VSETNVTVLPRVFSTRFRRISSVAVAATGLVLVSIGLTSGGAIAASIAVKPFGPSPSAVVTAKVSGSCSRAPGPNTIVIGALCLRAPIVSVGLKAGNVNVPADVHTVGWYDGSATTNSPTGSAAIVGHINYVGQGPGAFSALTNVRRGEKVGVNIVGQGVTYWRIISLHSVVKEHLTANLYSPYGKKYLTLITCGGTLKHYSDGWHYTNNVVVRAVPWS